MANTVNTTIVVTRNGQSTATNLTALPYAVFVALQLAMSSALTGLISMGVLKASEDTPGMPKMPAGGATALSFRLITDHGGGGASESLMSYTGISDKDADEITAVLRGAIERVMGKLAGQGAASPSPEASTPPGLGKRSA